MEKDYDTVVSWLTDKTLYVSSSGYDDGGSKSITHYRTIKRANGYSLVELDLETGRKNQIRVHMQDLGHPIAGDGRYGGENYSNPIGRLALHAFQLCFYHPVTGDLMEFETIIIFFHTSFYYGYIPTVGHYIMPVVAQSTLCFFVLGKHHQSGSVSVQTMYNEAVQN